MIEGHENKNIYVMETTIEGAQKRIAKVIDLYASYAEGYISEALDWRAISPDLEYIAVFLDSVGDEMAAITSSCNSLHARYVEACAENEALRKGNLNNLHAAHDNR